MFDVIVIGGGHAGVEAAHSIYRQGLTCCLVTFKKTHHWSNVMQPSNRRVGKVSPG